MLALGALFAVQNDATVPLDLLVVYLPARSVALWVLLALALGGILGLLTSLGIVLRLRARLGAAQRELKRQASSTQAAPPREQGTTPSSQRADA